jgi:hypothetical protein
VANHGLAANQRFQKHPKINHQPPAKWLPPEVLEPIRRQLGVADCVLNVPVSHVSLPGAGIMEITKTKRSVAAMTMSRGPRPS